MQALSSFRPRWLSSALGRAKRRVVVNNDQQVIHRMLPLSLTFDHRAVTGGEAARFLATLKSGLEKP